MPAPTAVLHAAVVLRTRDSHARTALRSHVEAVVRVPARAAQAASLTTPAPGAGCDVLRARSSSAAVAQQQQGVPCPRDNGAASERLRAAGCGRCCCCCCCCCCCTSRCARARRRRKTEDHRSGAPREAGLPRRPVRKIARVVFAGQSGGSGGAMSPCRRLISQRLPGCDKPQRVA